MLGNSRSEAAEGFVTTETPLAKDHRPVYIQIAETLRARIVSGYYDDRIDGEIPLARDWKVSRRTIQQALDVLVREGLVVRQHGMGTFVNRKGVERRYRAIASITESIVGQGLKPEYTVLRSAETPATEEEAAFFGVGQGDAVYRHDRLISGDGALLAVARTSLNLKYLEGLELSDLHRSLYATLRKDFGRTIVKAEDQYCPALADEETARLLGIASASAIFIAIRRATDQTGAPLEFSRIAMLPVPLDISIRHVGSTTPAAEELTPESREWSYTVGFGSFRV